MLDDGQYLDFLQKNYALNCESEDKDPSCDMRKGKLEEQKDRLHKLSRYHAIQPGGIRLVDGQPLLEPQVPVMEEIISQNNNCKNSNLTCAPTGRIS